MHPPHVWSIFDYSSLQCHDKHYIFSWTTSCKAYEDELERLFTNWSIVIISKLLCTLWGRTWDTTTRIAFSWIVDRWTLVPFCPSTGMILMLLYSLHYVWCKNIQCHHMDYILMIYIICDKNIFVQSPNFLTNIDSGSIAVQNGT
jgi:hypothetical protein